MTARVIAICFIFFIAFIIALFGLTIDEKKKKIKDKVNNIFKLK